jgi:HEPN domain-containing protein
VSPKAKAQLAREHLERALPAVSEEDYTEAVTWLFAALEAAIVAVAGRHGIDTQKQHWKKAEVAKELHSSGVLPHDFSDTLDLLNQARKVAVYEGDEPDLGDESLEDIATEVEVAVELAEQEGSP